MSHNDPPMPPPGIICCGPLAIPAFIIGMAMMALGLILFIGSFALTVETSP